MKISKVCRNDSKIEYKTLYEFGDRIPFPKLKFIKGNGKKSKKQILEEPIFLDTETSHCDEFGWIYQWALVLRDVIIVGRTPIELCKILEEIIIFYECSSTYKFLVYVHNLSYDWQYLKNYFDIFNRSKILAIAPHKILQVNYECFDMRCSYLLANKSLDRWSKDYNTIHRKAVGAIDYNIIRYQDSELNEEDWFYMVSDILSQKDAWHASLENDNVTTIPLTSTGYVRRDCRNEYKKYNDSRKKFLESEIDETIYNLLNDAYMGAITHGNRFWQARTYVGIVGHGDERSFYPSQIGLEEGFPWGTWSLLFEYGKSKFIKQFTWKNILEYRKEYCMLVTIALRDGEINKKVTCPVLSQVRCWQGRERDSYNLIYSDNGRVLKFEGGCYLTVTDLDLELILKQYHFKFFEICRVYSCAKKRLPKWLLDTNNKYFYQKTAFKIEAEEATGQRKIDLEIALMKSKNKLNGIYGMTATRPVREEYVMLEDGTWITDKEINVKDKLHSYYANYNNFMRFEVGCWITAYTRYKLINLIEKIGYDKFLYCDTDSIFYMKDEETEKVIQEENQKNLERCKKNNLGIKFRDRFVEYGTFEDENKGYDISKFRFLHAKCYAYERKNKLTCVIAGVPKYWREDADKIESERRTREQELKSIENLKENFKFTHCGGTTVSYFEDEIKNELINGHMVNYSSSAIISNCDKTLHELPYDYEYYISCEEEIET